ncbi:hypothetical protein ACQY0O_001153 [Thecaphora frezii]
MATSAGSGRHQPKHAHQHNAFADDRAGPAPPVRQHRKPAVPETMPAKVASASSNGVRSKQAPAAPLSHYRLSQPPIPLNGAPARPDGLHPSPIAPTRVHGGPSHSSSSPCPPNARTAAMREEERPHSTVATSTRKPLHSLALPTPPALQPRSVPTPQRKRVRLDVDTDDEASPAHLPLSGLSRPLPPPTPTSSAPNPRSLAPISASNVSLRPLNPLSIADIQQILPLDQLHPPDSRDRRRAAASRLTSANEQPLGSLPAPPVPQPPSIEVETLPWSYRCLHTGLDALDNRLGKWYEAVQCADEVRRRIYAESADEAQADPTAAASHRREFTGMPSGSCAEFIGPPGSGKTSLCLQMAVQERIDSLAETRLRMWHHRDASTGSIDVRPEELGKALFAEEYWDAELTSSNQVLLIDTEGGMLPERILDAVWAKIMPLWMQYTEDHTAGAARSEADEQPKLDRKSVPEVIRRLVAAVLVGLYVSRVTKMAELVAILSMLQPGSPEGPVEPADIGEAKRGRLRTPPGSAPCSILPPRTSLILIDTLSHPLRSQPSDANERIAREVLLKHLGKLQAHLNEPLRRTRPVDADAECVAEPIFPPTVVCTNQMSVRLFSPDGSASNFTSKEATSVLMPAIQGKRAEGVSRAPWREQPSVALAGPPPSSPFGDGMSQTLSGSSSHAATRRSGSGGSSFEALNVGSTSVLEPNAWRLLLSREGPSGERVAQIAAVPRHLSEQMPRILELAQAGAEAAEDEQRDDGVQEARERLRGLLRSMRQETFGRIPYVVCAAGLVATPNEA